jgi:hypothetical protein
MNHILKIQVRSLQNTINYIEEEVISEEVTESEKEILQSAIDILKRKLVRLETR